MRDVYVTIEALERKAADRAVTEPERDALLAKAAQLRAAAPPRPPVPPRRTSTAAAEPPWWGFTTTSSTTGTTTIGFSAWVNIS
jgi:hypothetical protein